MEDVYKNCPIYEDKDYTLRLVRLEDKGFEPTDEKLVGHDGTKYDSYFVVKKN